MANMFTGLLQSRGLYFGHIIYFIREAFQVKRIIIWGQNPGYAILTLNEKQSMAQTGDCNAAMRK